MEFTYIKRWDVRVAITLIRYLGLNLFAPPCLSCCLRLHYLAKIRYLMTLPLRSRLLVLIKYILAHRDDLAGYTRSTRRMIFP